MASSSTLRLRGIWFQVHKWIGILLAVLLIPLSLTGSALVWHDGLEKMLYPQRFAVSSSKTLLPPSAYIAAAQAKLEENDRVASLRFSENGEPVVLTALRPPVGSAPQARPLRINVWLDPANAAILDAGRNDAGIIRTLHALHGSLMIPGVGRQIVGWLGVAMLVSCISGIWLWWPTVGRWTRGLRWRRARDFDTNLHHMAGFWIAIPLAMLCFTGVWISFPAFFGQFSGDGAQMRERMAAMRALPLPAPAQKPDTVLAAVRGKAGETPLLSIEWPTDRPAPWKIGLGGDKRTNFTVEDSTGIVADAKSSAPQSGMARTMRQWHDGTGMGIVWQIIIFIGGIIPALLGITGILMWLRTRKWRANVPARSPQSPAPAE